MATYNTPLITTQGLSLLKAEIAGNDSVTFTKIVFSSDDYSQTADSSVQALTALSSLDLTATARSFTDVNGNLKIRGVANNQNTTSAFYIKTYGLYGKNKAGNEMLIAVSTAQNANFVPAYNGKQTNQIAYTFNIAVSSTNNITLSSSTDVDVTQADLAGINSAVNSNASSLTAQQSSYAGSVTSAISSNASNIANNSNNISSLQSSVSTNSSAIASNANNISSLQSSVANNSGAISGVQGEINSLNALTSIIPNINQQKYNMFGTDFNSYTETGTYTVYNMKSNLPNGLTEGVLVVDVRDAFDEQLQMFYDRKGNIYFRGYQSYPSPAWDAWTIPNNIASAISTLSSIYRGDIKDANNATSQGNYTTTEFTVNLPVYGQSDVGLINVVCQPETNMMYQIFSPMWHKGPMDELWFRSQGGGTWQAWHKIATEDDINNVQSSVAANSSAIATNSTNISSLQSSVANNSSAIASNATNISTNSSAISSLTSAQSSAVSSLAAKAVTYSGFVPVYDDLNNYTTPGIYDMRGSTYDTIRNSYYQGIGITLTVTSGGGAINQTIFSIRDDGRPQTNIRTLQKMGQWSRWYLQPTIDDVNDNAMVFRGNLPSTHMANITQTGIYNLGGIQTDDGPYPIQWGQLVVLNSGGVINQTVHDSSGTLFTRSINSWGIVGWNTNKH